MANGGSGLKGTPWIASSAAASTVAATVVHMRNVKRNIIVFAPWLPVQGHCM